MVFIKLLFVLVTIIFLYPANSANAKCTFDELKLGDDISKVGDNHMIDDMDPEQVVVYMSIKNACPNENLGLSSVEIAFKENKLVSFKITNISSTIIKYLPNSYKIIFYLINIHK